ncbi:MAG: 4Fe-4S dicluster domain-containing protein [Candidatus Latescibacteria bacterium]|nr:4Fe-4S dicluster domain-containing protein [Candidatus Latescibacterota bacterium]
MNHKIHVNESRCKGVDGCGLCIHVCPQDVFEKAEHLTEKGVYPPVPVYIEKCTACKMCMMYCPDLCIVVEKADK